MNRPSLSKRERTGASIAGIVGFVLVTLGLAPSVILYAEAVEGSPLAVIEVLSVVGLIVAAGSVMFSLRVLKRYGVNHRAGVTWSSIALAGLVHVVIAYTVLGLALMASASEQFPPFYSGPAFGFVYFGALAVLDALLGWLAWWWMAHAMRHRAVPTEQATPLVSVPQI
jgi:hypothetical protein